VATRSQQRARYGDNGNADSVRNIHEQIIERHQLLPYIYIQAFFISDIMNVEGNNIKEWAGRGQHQVGCQSKWEWPIQQRPNAWKAWKTSLEYLAPDGHIGNTLGDWHSQHHQIMEWYLDAHACTLYHHIEGVWTYHKAENIDILRFQVEAHSYDEPLQYSHVVEVCERARYIEIVDKHKIKETKTSVKEHLIEYTSGIGDSFHTLPRHIQRLVENIPEIEVPNGMDVTEEHGIIVATDGSVVYHIWVFATDKYQVLLTGGGPDDGEQLLMMSYRSELGGITSHDDFRGDTVMVHTTARMIEITHFARSNIHYGLYYSM
jgi:hypothetical protein